MRAARTARAAKVAQVARGWKVGSMPVGEIAMLLAFSG